MTFVDFLGQVEDTCWVPLAGAEDFYIHFANDVSEYAAERLFPRTARERIAPRASSP